MYILKEKGLHFTFIFCFIQLGTHALYFSFDTLDNLVLMEGLVQRNFSAQVPGQVVLYFVP